MKAPQCQAIAFPISPFCFATGTASKTVLQVLLKTPVTALVHLLALKQLCKIELHRADLPEMK